MRLLKFLFLLTLINPPNLFAAGRTVYISLVEKDSITSFISRFVSAEHQMVATLDPVREAIRTIKVSEEDHEQLFFVELTKASNATLDDEISRFGSVAVVKKPKSELHDGHFQNLVNPLEYWEAIPQTAHRNFPKFRNRRISNKSLIISPEIRIDESYMITKLKELSGEVPVQIEGRQISLGERYSTAGKNLARKFLRQEYESLGYEVREHQFGRFTKGVNFVAEKQGSDESYFMITSHYDTVRTVGADDDGSGLIAGLAIAKSLAGMNHEFGLRFVAFDQEERGLLGSKAYAAYLNDQSRLDQMLGLIQLEMLGWDEDNDFKIHVIDCNENSSADLTKVVLDTVNKLRIKLVQSPACTNRSDHSSFWSYNKPAIVISQNFFGGDSNPCYHRSCDKFANVNLGYLTTITSAAANSVAKLIGAY